MFKYRCAEDAFRKADYAVAQKFYEEIATDSPSLQLAAVRGIIDSMLCLGQWVSAEQCVDRIDFSQFEGLAGYDDLLLRVCFILVKNRRFISAENILARVDFAHLRSDMLAWYHLLNALILHDKRKFAESDAALELAYAHAHSDEQVQMINIFTLQNIVSEIGPNVAVNALESRLNSQILASKSGEHRLAFTKLYALFLNGLGRRGEASDALEKCLQQINCQEDMCAIKIYAAIVSPVLSHRGLANVKHILLSHCNIDTKLLAFKLLIGSVKTENDAALVAEFLDSLLSASDSDLLKRCVLLAKIAIFLNVERLDLCSTAASAYINLFPPDKFFGDIYELLAYAALDGKTLEYRNSAHYLGKLRTSLADSNVRAAITLKIADAFFYNHDFKLASDMYGEVLKFNSVGKCGHALVNQVLSDVALNNYEEAALHIKSANGGICEKLDGIVAYLEALKNRKMFSEALKYLDSLRLENAPNLTKYTLAVLRAEILFKKGQCAQALASLSKICAELSRKINAKEYGSIYCKSLFFKGCAAYKLRDCKAAGEAFETLRANFPNTKYFSLSLFREAKFLHKSGDTAKAISALEACVDEKYLPHATYRVALLKFHSGLIEESNGLLEKIIRDYPEQDIATAARIAQGDILRAMGDFANAQLIYEHGANFVSNMRDINYLSLAQAKCLIAQKNRSSQHLDKAIGILENLYANPSQSVSFRLECAAEYCLALKLQGSWEKLKNFALDILANVDDSGVQLTKKARHWLFQILSILHDSVQNFQGDGEVIEAIFRKQNMGADD